MRWAEGGAPLGEGCQGSRLSSLPSHLKKESAHVTRSWPGRETLVPTVHLQAQEAQSLDPCFLLPGVVFLVSALSAFSPQGSSLHQPPTTALTLLFVFPARVSPRVRLHLQAAGLWGESLI